MASMNTNNPDMLEFVQLIQEWHENRVEQLNLVANNESADINFNGSVIEADSPLAKGIRAGIQIALFQLGKLPFSVTENDSDEDEDEDWDD